jgi:hypothetical protein
VRLAHAVALHKPYFLALAGGHEKIRDKRTPIFLLANKISSEENSFCQ